MGQARAPAQALQTASFGTCILVVLASRWMGQVLPSCGLHAEQGSHPMWHTWV